MAVDVKGLHAISDANAHTGTSGTFTGALANGTTTVHTPHAVSALALDVTASTVFTKSAPYPHHHRGRHAARGHLRDELQQLRHHDHPRQ
jgi:hypothetical protein